MLDIHPTAVVDAAAELAGDVVVGPYAVIGPNVTVGQGTTIGAHCVIEGHTTIGRGNRIFHHALVGCPPQDLKYRGEQTTCTLGDHNDIREFVTIHLGTANGGGSTTVGSHNLLMVGAHVAHDSHIANHCVLSNNVMLAGHITVQDHAVIGGGTGVTQYVTVGRYAYIGGGSGVVHDCPPFMVTDGHPATVRSVNLIGLSRHNFDQADLNRLKTAYRCLFSKEHGHWAAAIAKLEAELGRDPLVAELCRFMHARAKQRHGRQAELHRRDDKRRTPAR